MGGVIWALVLSMTLLVGRASGVAVFIGVAVAVLAIGDLILGVLRVRKVVTRAQMGRVHHANEAIAVLVSHPDLNGPSRSVEYWPRLDRVTARPPLKQGEQWFEGYLPRGVYDTVDLLLFATSPLGLARLPGLARVPLRISVGPRRGAPVSMAPLGPTGVPEVSGVREGHARDSRRTVHWPTTARRGELMVKEHERRGASEGGDLVVALVLTEHDPEGSEAAVERAHSYAVGGLRQQRSVSLLLTTGSVPVVTEADVAKVLAGAVPGPVEAAPTGNCQIVRVAPEGDSWQ